MEKRNITISLPRSLLKKAKMLTVKREESLSQLMREALEEKVNEDADYKKARRKHLNLLRVGINLGTKGNLELSREEVHERR